MRKQTKLWTTATGERIRICDMADEHLLNTINFLRRYKQRICSSMWLTGSGLQGELAIEQFDQMILDFEDGDIELISSCGEALLDELERRKSETQTARKNRL